MKDPTIFCAVERGWQVTRLLSLELMHKGLCVDILIKGFVEKQVLDMITKYPAIRITAIRKFWFRPVLFFKSVLDANFGNLKGIVVEGKKIEKWLYLLSRCFKFPVFLIKETGLSDNNGIPADIKSLVDKVLNKETILNRRKNENRNYI